MYVDRHSLELLLQYSSPGDTTDENELREWLSVMVDKATKQARDEFAELVTKGDYPKNAVTPSIVGNGEVSLAIDQAPPAVILLLAESVDPDTLDKRNLVPTEMEESLTSALASWNSEMLTSMIGEDGWTPPPLASDDPDDAPHDPEPPVEPVPPPEDEQQGQDGQDQVAEGDESQTADGDPEDMFSRKKLILAVGSVAAVGVGVFLWRRRNRS
ncbi:MAG: hypothetical protein ACPG4T_11725 [Nannocystaceae bacterium]